MSAGPGPRRDLRSGAAFLLVGAVSFVVDAGLLWVFVRVVGLSLLPATTLAFATSFVVNFSGNRLLVFPGGGPARAQVPRYAVMVAISYLLTVAIVLGLTDAAVPLLVAKTVAVVVTACLNFEAGRRWVYR